MIEYFGSDKKRIDHALCVAHYSEEILKDVNARRDIVLISSYLHDIGIPEAIKKYGSAAGKYQEIEGPPIARKILNDLGIKTDFVDIVCQIISFHHTFKGLESLEFQVLVEADLIENLNSDFLKLSFKKKKNIIEKNFITKAGKKLAISVINNAE